MAPIICRKTRVVYFPTPKNASSALRDLFFELENGFPFRTFSINGESLNLFWLYGHGEHFKPVPAPEGFARIAVVRHPVDRFVSTYKFIALEKKLLAVHETPALDEFVERLEAFARNPTVRFHLTPQFKFLGSDLAYYDRVFRVEALDELSAYLSERSGVAIEVPVRNASAQHDIAVSGASSEKLRRIYQGDFALLGPLYAREVGHASPWT